MEVLQGPVDDRVGRVEHPRPGHEAEWKRRRPRQQDQEAQDPFAAERPQEGVREQARHDQDDQLRQDREQERVPDGVLER